MAFNPSKQGEPLSAPTNGRKNSTNDPGFENRQGYYPYDLSHTEVLATLYGLVVPSMHMITYMGDHHVVRDETKSILNRINGNFLNTVNQYVDSFFVSNRTMFPNNWDKLIPNPNKGDDLPNSARSVVPFYAYIREFILGERDLTVREGFETELDYSPSVFYLEKLPELFENFNADPFYQLTEEEGASLSFILANLTFVSSILSRGQLLDYLGVQFDFQKTGDYLSSFQYRIDDFFDKYYTFVEDSRIKLADIELNTTNDTVDIAPLVGSVVTTPSQFRDRYMHTVESGKLLWPVIRDYVYDGDFGEGNIPIVALLESAISLTNAIRVLFGNFEPVNSLADVDTSAEFNADGSCINLSKCLAYQLSIAQYYTNNTVDNIYTSDLFMQQLRGVMFPSVNGYTSEPTFDYNGVPTEYDYISYGGFYSSIFGNRVSGWYGRMVVLGSLLFTLRRSLRYGDKFTTGRTQMLAVGQLSIPVETDENTGAMSVNPINVTMEIVTQRFLNAANRVGNKPLEYYSSIMGVVPSDLPSIPRYVGHRKIEFENRVTTNTADEQGAQTTNLVGYSDDMAFDVYIDDYGILLSLNSYDCLPIYTSGIDSENFLSDRFEYFNPMMQNIGDEAIRLTELIGSPSLYDSNFAYIVRNSEYKYKLSKAHGALCYNMPGFLLKFPLELFDTDRGYQERIDHIGPDFIRDKPAILDSVITHTTGISPGRYFHFIVSVHNSVKSARLIQKAPGILF